MIGGEIILSDNFKPDSSIKKFLKEISSKELIKIINAILETNYPVDTKIFFENAEHFSILGSMNKSSVRGDLTIQLQDELKTERTNSVVLEIQASKDTTMGFRMFVYTLNVSELKKSDDKNKKDIYEFPKGVTIYLTNDIYEKSGIDEVNFKIENFRVGENKYSAKDNDLLTVEYPFINILAMDFSDFKNNDLELLKIIYPYKFKQKHSLLKYEKDLEKIIVEVSDYIQKFDNENDQITMGSLATDIFADIYNIAKTDIVKYGKVVEIMEVAEQSLSQMLIVRGEKNKSFKIAKEMLEDNLPISKIRKYTELTEEEIENIRKNI